MPTDPRQVLKRWTEFFTRGHLIEINEIFTEDALIAAPYLPVDFFGNERTHAITEINSFFERFPHRELTLIRADLPRFYGQSAVVNYWEELVLFSQMKSSSRLCSTTFLSSAVLVETAHNWLIANIHSSLTAFLV